MAVNVGGVKLDTKILDKITAEMRPKASRIIQKYGWAMVGDAVKIAPRDMARPPKDLRPKVSGSLRNSLTSESHMQGDMTFIIQDGVEYGLRQELGFVGEDSLGRTYNQAARPFITPSVEKWRDKFLQAFEGLFK